MDSILEELQRAALALSLGDKFRQLPQNAADAIAGKARDRVVEGNPRSWWLSLKCPHQSISFQDGSAYAHLAEYIPAGERSCWFIPETETETLPVFEADITVLKDVLSQCSLFEYYVVGKGLSW